MSRYLFLLLAFLLPVAASTQSLPIAIDGEFEDWDGASLIFDIDEYDAGFDDLHINRIWGANDDRFLFLRIELDREITLLDNNSLIFLLDTDNDRTTGYDADNFGAEVRWEFGNRRGHFYSGTDQYDIWFRHLRLRTAPTVSSTEFEIAVGRDAIPARSIPLFQSDTINVYFHTEGSEAFAHGTYVFDPEPVAPPDPIPLERFDENDLRVLAFNAWDDKVFQTQYTQQYRRILNTIEPDIIAFQEIWDHNADETARRIDELYPGGDDFQWQAVKRDNGNVTVSRFPIIGSWQILGWSRMTAALIDTREKFGTDVLLVNVHLRCCTGGEDNRWQEIAALMTFINNAREPGGVLYLDENTPIIFAGDFNLVGSRGQLEAIENNILDWDGSGIRRVRARQTEKRMNYTWRNDNSWFSPGKLDYIFYTGSVLTVQNHYTLQVEEMSPEQRNIYGLQYGDTQVASDHLPHVADFSFSSATGVKDVAIPEEYYLGQNYPNPFNSSTAVQFTIPEKTPVTLTVYDILGREVKRILEEDMTPGMYTVTIDGGGLSSGIYYYTLYTKSFTQTRKMVFIQ